MIIVIISIILIILLLIILNSRAFYNPEPFRNFSKTATPLIKNGFDLALMDQAELFKYERECAKLINKSFRRKFFFIWTYVVTKAEDAAIVLGSSKHINKSMLYDILHPFLKTGLLTSGGDKWHMRRRLLTPSFHFNILKEFCEIFKEESDKLVDSIRAQCNKKVDIIPISTKFTLNTVCESAMGVKLSELGDDGVIYRQNIYAFGKLLVHRIIRPWLHLNFIYSLVGYQKILDRVLSSMHSFTQSIIKKRKLEFLGMQQDKPTELKDEIENIYMGAKKKRAAMMDTLLQAQVEGLIDDEGIIEETDTFTFEGHDTTSNAMTFTLLLLAHHPEVQERILKEIQDITNGREDLKMDDLNKMNYMERVLKESMRLYPPVPFISRTFSEDVKIREVLYKKGTIVEIFICDIHRDPNHFPDPDKFNPDRFLPENCEKRHNFAYLAFSAGMRNCIGQRFAMLELKIMLAKVIRNFKILPITKVEDLVFKADIVLRAKDPIEMMFVSRK
ncbi:probable cytochrome P450 4ac2 [Chironomus tepperi]|uniref:probable cytochrome P450 4ac2 n=1 Tax=Chironomus tepperi TaxID=113505 RepID=UPI00391F1F8B